MGTVVSKKATKTSGRVYPRDLYKILQHLWDAKPLFPGWPKVELPGKPVFDELVDVCFHASMLTEEGRPTVFRIVFLSRRGRLSPRDNDPLPPLTRYSLQQPVPFTQGELRRLAPVADPRQVLIAVDQSDAHLQIYGLVDIGLGLWEMSRHERLWGYSSPEALVIMSSRPGELSISRGDRPVLRLRDGAIVTPADSVLYNGPISEFFESATVRFIINACQLSGVDQDPDEDDGLSFAYQAFVESILLYTAELKHGGTLLFVPEEVTHKDPRLLSRLNIKYVLPSTRPRDALVSAMAARLKHNALSEKLGKRRAVRSADMTELDHAERDQQNSDDAARDAARFVASLSAVDGAVVLTDMLRIIGFGAEVTASFSAGDTVHIADTSDAIATKEVSFAGYGTRHRSAFRFAASMEPSVAFVMSQDGGVKAVRQAGPKLLMWPYFKIGYTTALS